MKIAIDLDGTLGRYPQLIELSRLLQSARCEVFVLTAAAGELPMNDRPSEVRRRVNSIGGEHLKCVCIEQSDKPKFCSSHRVDILIDDTPYDLNGTLQLIPK